MAQVLLTGADCVYDTGNGVHDSRGLGCGHELLGKHERGHAASRTTSRYQQSWPS